MTRTDWEINITNLTESVVKKYGEEAAKGSFQRYDATCFDDLSPSYYTAVSGELMQMDEDD